MNVHDDINVVQLRITIFTLNPHLPGVRAIQELWQRIKRWQVAAISIPALVMTGHWTIAQTHYRTRSNATVQYDHVNG